jgi:hypothetical protein
MILIFVSRSTKDLTQQVDFHALVHTFVVFHKQELDSYIIQISMVI